MLSFKIRTIVMGSVAAAALTVPGVATAALVLHTPVTKPRVVHPALVIVAREVGSAGVEGYDDAECESLEKDWETVENFSPSSCGAQSPRACGGSSAGR